MSFNTGLSGLRAATSDLNVTGNNIANASTTGFKQSRAEFGDVYAASLTGTSTIGSGVMLQRTAQQFTQGNIALTQRDLDVAINGRGFFILNNGGERTYTRAGVFGVDKDGYVVSNTGGRLVGYAANSAGQVDLGNEVDLRIEAFKLQPSKTSEVRLGFNLDAAAAAVDGALYPEFDPADQNTFNFASSVTLYDSEGIPHVGTMYFRKDQPDPAIETGVNNDWFMWLAIDGELVNDGNPANPAGAPLDPDGDNSAFLVRFNEDGTLDPATNQFVIDDWVPALQIQSVFDSNAEHGWASSQMQDRSEVRLQRRAAGTAGRCRDPDLQRRGRCGHVGLPDRHQRLHAVRRRLQHRLGEPGRLRTGSAGRHRHLGKRHPVRPLHQWPVADPRADHPRRFP